MKLSLPSKLTLGKKPKVEEEIKNDDGSGPDSPKYSSAEVKLAVIAIEVSKGFPLKFLVTLGPSQEQIQKWLVHSTKIHRQSREEA